MARFVCLLVGWEVGRLFTWFVGWNAMICKKGGKLHLLILKGTNYTTFLFSVAVHRGEGREGVDRHSPGQGQIRRGHLRRTGPWSHLAQGWGACRPGNGYCLKKINWMIKKIHVVTCHMSYYMIFVCQSRGIWRPNVFYPEMLERPTIQQVLLVLREEIQKGQGNEGRGWFWKYAAQKDSMTTL